MAADEMNLATYIRERSEELQKLSKDARLDLLVHLFGVTALEATKHEHRMPPPEVPNFKQIRSPYPPKNDDIAKHRASIRQVLESLIDVAVKRLSGKAQAAFYVANHAGTGLHRLAGMTPAYGAYTDGFKISERSLACGLAAATRRPVITNDVTKDPAWTEWQWLAKAFNYRGCWSFPIEGRGGKVLGTFSLYLEDPSQPNDRDMQFASVITDTAAEIIGRYGHN